MMLLTSRKAAWLSKIHVEVGITGAYCWETYKKSAFIASGLVLEILKLAFLYEPTHWCLWHQLLQVHVHNKVIPRGIHIDSTCTLFLLNSGCWVDTEDQGTLSLVAIQRIEARKAFLKILVVEGVDTNHVLVIQTFLCRLVSVFLLVGDLPRVRIGGLGCFLEAHIKICVASQALKRSHNVLTLNDSLLFDQHVIVMKGTVLDNVVLRLTHYKRLWCRTLIC